ncbi:MAG: BON domain-containing protein [Mucilaginibacter sp.]|uniref:BON domain-containing protein n=1 Tax=Mucilaginibacter sp. TaxID=1882438 RepID=UPI0034E4C43F
MTSKPIFRLNKILFSLFLLGILSSCSQQELDKEIKADLTTKAKTDLNLAAVNYMVEDGVVTLTGKCASEKSKSEAEQTVKGINIVKGIVNHIEVAPVVLTTNFPLKQAADSVLKTYPTVRADVKGDTIVLEGKAKSQDAGKILAGLKPLHPQKIENQLKAD